NSLPSTLDSASSETRMPAPRKNSSSTLRFFSFHPAAASLESTLCSRVSASVLGLGIRSNLNSHYREHDSPKFFASFLLSKGIGMNTGADGKARSSENRTT